MSIISYIVLALECRENIQHSTMSITKSALAKLVSDTDNICRMLTKLHGFTSSLCKAYSICLRHKTAYCFIFLLRDPLWFFFSRHSDKFIRACLGWVQQNICLIPVSVLTSWILPCEGFPFFKVLRMQSGLNLGISLCIVFYVLGVCHLQGKDFTSKDDSWIKLNLIVL